MRVRLLRGLLAVAVAGIAVLGFPLGIVASHVVRDEETTKLEREADRVVARIDDDLEVGRRPSSAAIERVARDDRLITVVDRSGGVVEVGEAPSGASVSVTIRTEQGAKVTVVAPAAPVRARQTRAWAVVAALSLAGIAAAIGVAVIEARRLARPLDVLAKASERLGAGDFSVRVPASGVPEVDAVAAALETSGSRIADLVRRERDFSADASHQLRTPLTALRLQLEEALLARDDLRPAVVRALGEVERLETTITQLLALARSDAVVGAAAVADILAAGRTRWSAVCAGAGRHLVVEVPAALAATNVADTPVREVLNVLVDNAVVHGAGTIRVVAHRAGEHVALAVTDEGRGVAEGDEEAIFERHVSGGGRTGVGLALAKTLADSIGGRLVLAQRSPPRFELYAPVVPVAGDLTQGATRVGR